jgi:hypothetical protein
MTPIPGPVWKNQCNHPDTAYVGSFRIYAKGSRFGDYDLYVFDEIGNQGVCIREGNEGNEYCSPGEPIDMVRHIYAYNMTEKCITASPVYLAATEMLMSLGSFSWIQLKNSNALEMV